MWLRIAELVLRLAILIFEAKYAPAKVRTREAFNLERQYDSGYLLKAGRLLRRARLAIGDARK